MKKLFLVFVLLLAATAAVAATSDSNPSPATVAPAIRTYLMPDLSLKSVFSPDLLPQTAAAPQPDTVAGGPKRTGFCRCSCGFQCTSSADCGGSSCDPFITCCERKGQRSDAEWFRSSMASHKAAVPETILKADCK
jgi:hypothetical protein